ncbi:hypothetical protein SEVIR_1G227001v4 [Setaria viridis]
MDIAQGQGYPLEIIIITDDSSPMPTDDDIPAWVHWPEFYPRRASSEAPRSSKRARVAATEDAILGLQEVTGRSGDECAVCLQDFRAEETLRAMPCSHAFHQHCISQWLRRNAVCPLCRHELTATPTPEEKEEDGGGGTPTPEEDREEERERDGRPFAIFSAF